MTYFVNEFTFGEDAAYRTLISADVAGGIHVAGALGARGLLAAINAAGVTDWQRVYTIEGKAFRFWSGVRCDNGDFMLHGSLVLTSEQNKSLIVRVSGRGDAIWAKSYTRDRTRFNVRLVKGLKDTYFFTSWYNQSGSTVDTVEVVRIDGTGNVLAAVSIDSGGDDQVNTIIPYNDGCIVAGGTGSGAGWDCFVVALDGNLGVTWKKLIGNNDFQEIRHLVPTGPDAFVITGETGPNRKTFMARMTARVIPGTTGTDVQVPAVLVYDLKSGQEFGTKRLLLRGSNIYLAATTPAAPLASFVASFNLQLELLWQKSLAIPGSCSLLDIGDAADGVNGLVVCGNVTGAPRGNVALLAHTDSLFASCKTVDLSPPHPVAATFQIQDWNAVVTPVKMTVNGENIGFELATPAPSELCRPGIGVDLERNPRIQSPYIYLQAAGSDFSDQTARGFQLRWDLLRGLGRTHLPKGKLAAPAGPWHTAIGYNRADDFVRIYGAELKNDYGVDVKLGQPPSTLFESGAVREWLYEDLASPSGPPTDVSVRFADVPKYDALRAGIDPHVNPQALIDAYTGVIEVRTVGKLCFLAVVVVRALNPPVSQRVRVEAITLPDPLDNTSRTLGCRRSFTSAGARVVCENIEAIRFDYAGVVPIALHLAPYENFLYTASARHEWFEIGTFSLDNGNTDGDANVFRRLENPPGTAIDGIWPRFRRVPEPGVFRVRAQNYRDRWRMTDGLKQAVTTYLDASRSDAAARVVTHNSDPVPNDSAVELSYLDLLNFVSLDFHVARMLGLGTIDPNSAALPSDQFLYLMQYVTEAQLEHEPPARVTHYYMTPPLRMIDQKPPPAPVVSLSYGLPVEECEGTTSALTDTDGYAVFDQIRFVNLDRAKFRYELPMQSFFQTADEFCLCEETVPVSFGVRYGAGPAGSGNDVRPELSNNPAWRDPAGLEEVSQIPERGANPVYTHQERSPGVHHYQLYSINWFSRTHGDSNEVQTDVTTFTPRNTLLPPSNLAVQLIQKEDPRIFTSVDEQQRLAQLPSGDKTLLRVTFDWNDVQNRAYYSVDTVELYFRTLPPQVVRGEIASVVENPATHTATITTKPYLIASTDPPQTVQPEITAPDVQRFAGGRLSVRGETWLVESVAGSGVNPTLVLKQIRTTASVDADLNDSFCTVESWHSPNPHDRFLIAENLDNPGVWDTKLTKEVSLVQFSPPFSELIVNNDGQSRSVIVGGLADSATVVEIPDSDPLIGTFVPAGGPSTVPSGAYTITLAHSQLAAGSDPDVEFFEGIVRMPDLNGKTRVLRVWNIDNSSGATLKVVAYDAEFGLKRDGSGEFQLSGSQFVPVDGYVPVQTGNVAQVNFHPSYRVYLTADVTTSGHNFGEPAILPARGEGSRQTLFTARSRATPAGLTSRMSKPVVILAQELRDPVAPGPLLGPLFATRPNFFGKATFTVDVQVDDPYALVFYKANDRKIIDQLYEPKKAGEVVAQLDTMPDFERTFDPQRWSDFVHVVTDADDEFIRYVLDGFRFPPPNNDTYFIPDPSLDPPVRPFPKNNTAPPGTMKAVVQEAIEKAFVPITELPLIYAQLNDKTLQTSGRPPKLRDAGGKRLPPHLADPWPMAVRYEKNANGDVLQHGDAGYGNAANTRWVRFTDYTIDGASKNVYFYFAVELSNTMKVSARSPITGPVQLVNSSPPEAPVIRKVTVQLDDGADARPQVDFLLSAYLPSEGVTAYRLYRALDADDALSVRTMTEVKEFALGDPVFDDFADLGYVPFAQPIHYRAVAFRSIINEQGLPEKIPSRPSEMAMARIADTVNPQPPQISMTSDPVSLTHPFQYANVELSWPRTTYRGTYHLYKQNDVGIWVKIATLGDAPVIEMKLQDTSLGSDVLLKENSAGDILYHRFRVTVVNTSGLMNLQQNELTV